MSNACRSIYLLPLVLGALAMADDAAAQSCPTMRKINIGVSVAPPNVVHTSPYVAKDLGFFAKRCIEPNIIQFEGGQSATSAAAAAQGTAIVSVGDVADRPRPEGAAVLGLGAPDAAGLHGVARRQDRGRSQGQEAQRDRRRRRRLQLAHGPRSAQDRGPHGRRRAIHLLRHRGPAAGPGRRPDRRRGAASRGRLSRQEAEADAQSPGAAGRADAELHVQRLRRLARLDRHATARCCAMPPPR